MKLILCSNSLYSTRTIVNAGDRRLAHFRIMFIFFSGIYWPIIILVNKLGSNLMIGKVPRGVTEILSRVVYEELGGDPFFFNTVDEFHSFHNISQALRTM